MMELDELKADAPREIETLRAMSNIANSRVPCFPTDGGKITMSMLDSKSDLRDLIKDCERFRFVSNYHGCQ